MIKKLQRKFIILSISSVFIVLAFILVLLNASNYMQIGNHANEILTIISENNGYFPKSDKEKDKANLPKKISPEAPFSTRYFTAKLDNRLNLISIDTGKIAATSTSEAVDYVDEVLQNKKTKGLINIYKYQVTQKDYGKLIVFVDVSRDLEMFRYFLFNSLLIFLISLSGISILILLLSKKAVEPIAKGYEKQKQFITDASHELKTPLTIISTNAEVLEMTSGENEWTKSIRNQVERLSLLVSSLVDLTRMDEDNSNFKTTDFSLSDAVEETVEHFILVFNSQYKSITINIDKNISYHGNEESIRQLVSILLDNAAKYSNSKSEIKITLKKQGKKSHLSVTNEAEGLKKGNLDILFERFYRTDSSRNIKTGGYGIGLSIAKAITINHKGKISAYSPDGKSITITVIL